MIRKRVHILGTCLFFGVLTTGCFKRQIITAPCPPPPAVFHPTLRVHSLKPDSNFSEILTAYVLDLTEIDGYARRLEALLDAYRPAPEPAKKLGTK